LWISTPLQVQCNHFLCFYYIFCENCCTSPKCRRKGGLFLKAGSSECISVHSKALLFLASIPAFYMPLQHAWPKWATNFPIIPFETFVKKLLLSRRLVRTNYIPKHSLDHVDSEYTPVSVSVSVSFNWRPRPKIEAETGSKLLETKADVEIAANCPWDWDQASIETYKHSCFPPKTLIDVPEIPIILTLNRLTLMA